MVPTLEYPGVRYPGRMAVSEIYDELRRQAAAYRDYVVANKSVALIIDTEFGLALQFTVAGKQHKLPISKRGYDQILAWIGLRKDSKLYKRLRFGNDNQRRAAKDSDCFWPTYVQLVNDHFQIIRGKKLIRTLQKPDGEWYVRALLSDRYRIIPNDQLFMCAAEKIKSVDAEIWDARLSEDAFYLYAVAPGITAQVRTDRPFGNGNARWAGDSNDVVNAAIMMRNSETGQGGCEVCPAILEKVSGAYLVRQNALSVRHLGHAHEMDALLSVSTIKKQNSLVFDKVKDYVDSTFTEDTFQEFVSKLQDATQDEVADPIAAADAVRAVYDLSEKRRDSVLKWLMVTGDRSRYGLASAIAREAHDDADMNADEAVMLERVSSDLIENQTVVSLARNYKRAAEQKATRAARAAEEVTIPVTAAIDLE